MKRRRRLRKLVPDARRAAGEPLRELASDYQVSHTTLGRFFERPDVAKDLREAAKQLRAEERALAARRSAERRLERDVRRKARERAAAELEQARRASAALAGRTSRRLHARSSYEAWLDERDARVPLTRADLHSQSDETAARVVAEGGGIQAVIDATDLRTLDNAHPALPAHAGQQRFGGLLELLALEVAPLLALRLCQLLLSVHRGLLSIIALGGVGV